MDHGIPNGHFQRFHKFQIPFISGLISRNIRLRHTVRAHDAPLVVVAEIGTVRILTAQPNLREILKTAVFIDFSGWNVAVVVHKGLPLRVIVEKVLCGIGVQKKIPVHKRFHRLPPLA